jgi:hypothetical protein
MKENDSGVEIETADISTRDDRTTGDGLERD